MSEIKRGDIRYIDVPYSFGHEMAKNRPGIILSPSTDKSGCVTVVYLTSVQSHHVLPTHVTIRSTGTLSWAKCEHIYTVDITRVRDLVGKCNDVEMKRVKSAVSYHLGISRLGELTETMAATESEPGYGVSQEEVDELKRENLKLTTLLDTYKELYEKTLKEALAGRVVDEKAPEKPKKPTFGSRLREARLAANLQQIELSEKSGVNPKTISYYEVKDKSPSMGNAMALAKALNVSLAWLCCVEEE